uniref:Max-binding protein MNT n=1 Tax=Erpetoichthys calabaricus TaxID=27687 RepID=A0A8C4XA79_ERPCA
MSIETLLEAARFLEWQAQQQQKTREENEKKDKLCLDRDQEWRPVEVLAVAPPSVSVRTNHVTHEDEPCLEHQPAAVPPPTPPPPVPLVFPIPVVTSSPVLTTPQTPISTLSPPGPRLSPAAKDCHSPSVPQRLPIGSLLKTESSSASPIHGSPKQSQSQPLVQAFSGPVVTATQHHVIQPSVLPQSQPSAHLSSSSVAKLGSAEDSRQMEQKRRPGGAGTREVHNKLEKNRRAHLKECFETLKRNIPNVDDKKTSNLSVLRSALRYIQTLKRKEKEYEHEMERLAREKIATQQRLAELKNELSQWMDIMEIDRVLRQTVQPEDDQASTSTASEGEDNIDQDMDDGKSPLLSSSLPKVPPRLQPELLKPVPTSSILSQHIPVQHKAQSPVLPTAAATAAPLPAQTLVAPPAMMPAHTHIVTTPTVQPTVIAHAAASASHASVIQAVNHVIQTGTKHIAHIAPSSSNSVQLAAATQPIGHITVHPATLNHLSQHLPAIYQQPVAVTQPTVMSHIAHTLSHPQVNGTASSQQTATVVGKQATVGTQVVTHHPQLVGSTVLNPVTMVTMPSFPVSTLKLA